MKSSKIPMVTAAAIAGLMLGASARAAELPSSRTAASVTRTSSARVNASALAGIKAQPMDDMAGKHDCKGKNDCKSAGGCKTGDNGCKGKNSCKGKGGRKTAGPSTEPAKV